MNKARAFTLIAILFLKSLLLFGQQGMWTWMSGNNNTATPHYGIQGIPDLLNTPAGNYECNAWTDLDGNFWLFGGVFMHYGDMWKYDVQTNMWTWINGPGIMAAPLVYGVQGIPSPLNHPSDLGFGADTWTDNEGDLWIFGGTGNGALGDLWRYHIPTNEWTWMKGPGVVNPPGLYGTKGVSSPANYPRSRTESTCNWVSTDSCLWLFGGYLESGDRLGDLWKYNLQTNEWTWMKGDSNLNELPIYGTQGVPSQVTEPGAREIYANWTDTQGQFYLFGGNSSTIHFLNDLWRYNSLTNEWTWISGNNIQVNYNSGIDTCSFSPLNIPAGRWENKSCWKDNCGHFYNLGGLKFSGNNTDDLWAYSISTNQWCLIRESSGLAIYGTKNIPNSTNTPGLRVGACSWTDLQGNFWLFGNYENYNSALWKYTPDVNCPSYSGLGTVQVSPDTTICLGDTIQLSASGGTYYSWLPANSLNDASISHPLALPQVSTQYQVTIYNDECKAIRYINITIANTLMHILNPDTTLCAGQSTLLKATGGTQYKWSNGLTTSSILVQPMSTSKYFVTITNSTGCTNTDSILVSVLFPPVLEIVPNQASLCKGQFITLNVSGAQSYQWYPGTWLSSAMGNIVIATPLESITYIVCGIGVGSCKSYDSISLKVWPLPQIVLQPDPAIACEGDTLQLKAFGALSYNWSPAEFLSDTSGNIVLCSPDHNITYTIVGTDDHNCSNSKQLDINVKPKPVTLLKDSVILCLGTTLLLKAGYCEGCTYKWQDGETTPYLQVSKAGLYIVTVTQDGCSNSATVRVKECTDMWVPNAFTPVGDLLNDIFLAKASTELNYFNMRIFDRWGELLFESNDINTGWDGRFKGEICKQDIYVWTIVYEGINKIRRGPLKGSVMLIRK